MCLPCTKVVNYLTLTSVALAHLSEKVELRHLNFCSKCSQTQIERKTKQNVVGTLGCPSRILFGAKH